jgi:hypothetical protein
MRSELSLIKNRLDEHRNVLSLALNNKEIVNLERWLSQLEQFNQQIGELGNFADTAHATYQASLEKASGHLEKTVQILSEKYGKKKAQEAIVKAQQLESSAQFLMSVNASVKTIDLPLVFSKFLDLPFYAPIYRSNIQFLSDLKVCEQETLEDWMKTGCQNLIPVKADVRRYLGETLPGILKDNLEIAALMSGDHKIESALKNVQKHLDNENLEKAVLAYDQAIAYGESLGSRD